VTLGRFITNCERETAVSFPAAKSTHLTPASIRRRTLTHKADIIRSYLCVFHPRVHPCIQHPILLFYSLMAGNFLPGTASLLEELDSEFYYLTIFARVTSCAVLCHRKADGPAARWANTDRILEEHRPVWSVSSDPSQSFDLILLSLTGNIVLHRTIERIHVGDKYGDIDRGIFLIRGENMVLCGEVRDMDHASGDASINLIRVPVDEILELQHSHLSEKQESDRLRRKAMADNGMSFFQDQADRDDF
jgi:U6 snRNA-associated Sm-like protein LSm1